VTPPEPAVRLPEPLLEVTESVVLNVTGAAVAPGMPGSEWQELLVPVPDDVGNGRLGAEGSEPSVGAPGTDGAEPSDVGLGREDGGVGRLGTLPVPAVEEPEPEPETVTPPPEPLPDTEPPEGPADPCSVAPPPVPPGSPDGAEGADGSPPPPGTDGNAVSGKEGRPLEGREVGRDWALAGAIDVPATSPPARAPPTAQAMAPDATARSRRCRRAFSRRDVQAPPEAAWAGWREGWWLMVLFLSWCLWVMGCSGPCFWVSVESSGDRDTAGHAPAGCIDQPAMVTDPPATPRRTDSA
jgi:hypothetical protein